MVKPTTANVCKKLHKHLADKFSSGICIITVAPVTVLRQFSFEFGVGTELARALPIDALANKAV